jgi:hypothetical protein
VRVLPLGAGVKRRDAQAPAAPPPLDPPTLDGLSPDTREQLRVLATGSLQAVGMRDPSPRFVQDEMQRQCAQLAASLPPTTSAAEREAALQLAITRAIERLDDER